MSDATEGDALSDFLGRFLPELELLLNGTAASSTSPESPVARISHGEHLLGQVSEKLEELRNYYGVRRLAELSTQPGRKAVVAINVNGSWVPEVKSCSLFADHVICEDPFLSWIGEATFSNNDRWRWGGDSLSRSAIDRLRWLIEMAWDVMPLIRSGILRFFPISDPFYVGLSESMADTIKGEVLRYLMENLVIVNNIQHRYFTVRIPVIDFEGIIEFDRDLWWGDIDSYQEMAARTCAEWLSPNSVVTAFGLRSADLVSGTFWTSSDMHWKLCGDAVQGLSRDAKGYSFIHTFTRPALERLSSRDLLSVRNQEDAFYFFRKEMLVTESLITANVGDAGFQSEIQGLFRDIYEPNFAMIEAAMHQNLILKNLPWAVGSSGFAYAAAVASASPISATIFGTLSAALGFGPLFKDIADRRVAIRREPAYVFWKLDRLAE
jgi:hypothetical protein